MRKLLALLAVGAALCGAAKAECYHSASEAAGVHGVSVKAVRYSHHLSGFKGQECWFAPGWRTRVADVAPAPVPKPLPVPKPPATPNKPPSEPPPDITDVAVAAHAAFREKTPTVDLSPILGPHGVVVGDLSPLTEACLRILVRESQESAQSVLARVRRLQ